MALPTATQAEQGHRAPLGRCRGAKRALSDGEQMNQNLKVSVAMPVFNGGHYFELALKSALAQTYSSLEIVIVNDGSTDGGETAAIAERYAARHASVKYVYQQNRGAGGALNTVLAEM